MSTICELKNKLNEVITLVPLISQPEKQEAVLLWNYAATKIEHMVNSCDNSTGQTSQQDQGSYCHRETYSAVEDDSNVNLIDHGADSSNNHSMSIAPEFESIIDTVPPNPPVDRHFEIGGILDDTLFNLTSNTNEDVLQARQDVIVENILTQSLLDSARLSSNVDYDNSLAHSVVDIASPVIDDPMCLSFNSTPITSSRTDATSGDLLNLTQQPDSYSSSDATNQVSGNSITMESSRVINEIDTADSLVSSCLNCDDPTSENVQCSKTCDIACDIDQDPLDHNFDAAIDQVQLGVPSIPTKDSTAITHCLGLDACEMRPLQQLQIYVPQTVIMNGSRGDEDPGCNPLGEQTIGRQDQPTLAITADASNSSPQNVDYFRNPEQSLAAQANNNSTLGAQLSGNPHACQICGKTGFSTKGNLKRHQKTHSGEKPFACDFCDRKFTENKGLKIHLRKHSGEKPFNCEICHKQFTQAHMLKHHMAVHTDERKFPCSRCSKSFRQNSQLKLHSMRHDGIKKLECTSCPRKFVTKGDLERHIRTHTGERPYACTMCPKTFTRQQSLNEHLNRHTGKKPYTCPHCPKDFSEMSAWHKHKKMHAEAQPCQSDIPPAELVPVSWSS